MNKIHSGLLALVLSIFLIHAADPPYEKPSGTFLSAASKTLDSRKLKALTNAATTTPQEQQQDKGVQTLVSNEEVINTFLQRQGKTEYEKLLEKEYIRPLLKLYGKQYDDGRNETLSLEQLADVTYNNGSSFNSSSEELGHKILEQVKLSQQNNPNSEESVTENGRRFDSGDELGKEILENVRLSHKAELKDQQNPQNNLIPNSYQQDASEANTSEADYTAIIADNENSETDQQTSASNYQPDQIASASIRRDDSVDHNNDHEHIGEILFPATQVSIERRNSMPYRQSRYGFRYLRPNLRSSRKYDFPEPYRDFSPAPSPPVKRFRPSLRFPDEYDGYSSSEGGYGQDNNSPPSGLSNDYHEPVNRPPVRLDPFESSGSSVEEQRIVYSRQRVFPPSTLPQGYRLPRRLPGEREHRLLGYSANREPFPEHPWTGAGIIGGNGGWNGRRPRVIFPQAADLVSFRDPPATNTETEPDWLAGDGNLQDLQQTDNRDRGKCCFSQYLVTV